MKNKRLTIIFSVVAVLLLIPLIAMQFTKEVHWTLFDFAIAGILLLGTGLLIDLVLRKVKNYTARLTYVAVLAVTLILVWAELAVGIFGTPFAGQ